MPENCKYDLFQVKFLPKWGKSTDHDENVSNWKGSQDTPTSQIANYSSHAFKENCQRHQIWPVSPSQNDAKKGKWTDHDQNLISSEGGQDTSACQSSGHSSLAFSRKCLEVANFARFTKSKWCQSEENQQMMTQILSALKWSGYISMSNFRPFKVTAIKIQVCGSYHKH